MAWLDRGLTVVGSLLALIELIETFAQIAKWMCTVQVMGFSTIRPFWRWIVREDRTRIATGFLGAPLQYYKFWVLVVAVLLGGWYITGATAWLAFAAFATLSTTKRILDRACPRAVLFLATSSTPAGGHYLGVRARLNPCKVANLLEPGALVEYTQTVTGGKQAYLPLALMWDLFRTRDDRDWQRVFQALADFVALVVLDASDNSSHLGYEVSHLIETGHIRKTVFLADSKHLIWAQVLRMCPDLSADVARNMAVFSAADLERHLAATFVAQSRSGLLGRLGYAIHRATVHVAGVVEIMGILAVIQRVQQWIAGPRLASFLRPTRRSAGEHHVELKHK